MVARQYDALNSTWETLGFRFIDETLRWIELQFLWGIFHEAIANGPTFPTNGYDRIVLCLIDFLINERGLDMPDAKATALQINKMFNEADCLFDSIEARGRSAYRTGSHRHFVDIVLALHDSGASREAYSTN
ncbi:hypothetical protein H8A97_40195 [Bradyrhizobium sp. Arg62]|uniref:hypothetical protein n=1 Tax=Bradyrhizobium brasilense TaxID=1419277 RepID=UPI001E45B61C|nr:hypothetical protein [Bradyrhizobium brasilense]MCC8951113.1 hypothetical protein [Bradyrhizobium brasilense]